MVRQSAEPEYLVQPRNKPMGRLPNEGPVTGSKQYALDDAFQELGREGRGFDNSVLL
jgi:hypothetical protein